MHARENLTLLKPDSEYLVYDFASTCADPEYFTGVFRGIFKFAREGGGVRSILWVILLCKFK